MNKIFLLVLLLLCCSNLEAATVRLEPSVISTVNGTTFTVNVVIEDAVNLMGAEIFVGFDPTKLGSETMNKGEMLGRNGATVVFFTTTTTGKVGFAASCLGGNPTGVTGSGTIAQLSFKYIGQSDSWLNIDSTDLRDTSLQAIQVTGTTGVTVTAAATHGTVTVLIIEPATSTAMSGDTMVYTATAKDADGNTWTVTTDTVFSSDDTAGTWTGSNTYTAGRVGTWTITGTHTATGKVGTATVIVQPAFGKRPSDVIVYPNPCKGTEIIFRNLPEEGATIEIYDLAGDLVKRVHGDKAEYRWHIRDDSGQMVDSGVYFYAIIGKKESTRGKVVIIR